MGSIHIADQAFIVGDGAGVREELGDPERWHRWWPDLQLEVLADRGEAGIRFSCRGGVVGSMELWLEPALDGVIVHYFLDGEPPGGPIDYRAAAPIIRQRRVQARVAMAEAKARLEAGRAPGVPPATLAGERGTVLNHG